ncbi:hypothetical protein SARC_14664 [Sphaeroforma arctica JP610]|uniref:Uncharacterized protein n=1 Tax=Sphaeroforma arctica JP610 TaxID=667725 RepID=A0A0L0F8A3_9EUKA|nr:hypothetical protein SARC_14664 [Sphaeroforma arctica JP610]KNC72776.1 hypothetical protein SARC_14664 [Sphaeroforma arctica JP610]|eukprot:XP_014146678.1 hypothetical protein SARC_14664 [Sphaeroforma arctica JP610]
MSGGAESQPVQSRKSAKTKKKAAESPKCRKMRLEVERVEMLKQVAAEKERRRENAQEFRRKKNDAIAFKAHKMAPMTCTSHTNSTEAGLDKSPISRTPDPKGTRQREAKSPPGVGKCVPLEKKSCEALNSKTTNMSGLGSTSVPTTPTKPINETRQGYATTPEARGEGKASARNERGIEHVQKHAAKAGVAHAHKIQCADVGSVNERKCRVQTTRSRHTTQRVVATPPFTAGVKGEACGEDASTPVPSEPVDDCEESVGTSLSPVNTTSSLEATKVSPGKINSSHEAIKLLPESSESSDVSPEATIPSSESSAVFAHASVSRSASTTPDTEEMNQAHALHIPPQHDADCSVESGVEGPDTAFVHVDSSKTYNSANQAHAVNSQTSLPQSGDDADKKRVDMQGELDVDTIIDQSGKDVPDKHVNVKGKLSVAAVDSPQGPRTPPHTPLDCHSIQDPMLAEAYAVNAAKLEECYRMSREIAVLLCV